MYPKVKIDLEKIKHNSQILVGLCKKHNVSVTGVTKVFAADEKIVEAMINSGVNYLADSRIQNLKKLQHFDLKKTLLRIPMQSEVDDVVKYSDISLNSELKTIE
jgi:ornithine racemase